jgi:hypothetical protein
MSMGNQTRKPLLLLLSSSSLSSSGVAYCSRSKEMAGRPIQPKTNQFLTVFEFGTNSVLMSLIHLSLTNWNCKISHIQHDVTHCTNLRGDLVVVDS